MSEYMAKKDNLEIGGAQAASNVYAASAQSVGVGSKVKVIGAKYTTGQTIPNWVKNETYTVQQISSGKVLIKEIMSWVYANDVSLISGGTAQAATAPAKTETKTEVPKEPAPAASAPPAQTTAPAAKSIGIGSTVKITGSTYATGQKIPSWVLEKSYTVSQINGDRGLMKEIVSWVKLSDLALVSGGTVKPADDTKPAASGGSSGDWKWPSAAKAVTSKFGYRKPILLTNGTYSSDQHDGVDICGGHGTAIYAAKGGTATNKTTNTGTGYGRWLEINHGDGTSTRYAHLSAIHKTGSVNAGDTIASEGATGGVTGAHLHFEVRVGGTAKDPLNYIKS